MTANSKSPTETSFGRFLDYSTWKDALNLLKLQVASQDTNRHFKTLSMIYYQNLGASVDDLDSEDYFQTKIANGLFYGLQKEFAAFPYLVPKSSITRRPYLFLTYPMRTLYYSVSLYLLKVTQEFLNNYHAKLEHVRSFYGGRLIYDEGKLALGKDKIYFRDYYRAFKETVRKHAQGDQEDKIVIRLDIQNCYENISIPRLLELIDAHVKDSIKAKYGFDEVTFDQIAFFFKHIANGNLGIPQADNCIASTLIGHLYLVFADLLITDLLCDIPDPLVDYSIARYVDDIYITLQFSEESTLSSRMMFVETFNSALADSLSLKMGLRLNTKTRIFSPAEEAQFQELQASVRRVSPDYYIDEDDEETPQVKLETVLAELETLGDASLHPSTLTPDRSEEQREILKNVFDTRVVQMLAMQESQNRLRAIFENFNFNRVKLYPLPIIIILLKEGSSRGRFRSFLLERINPSTDDVDLILQYLCQVDFNDDELAEKLKEHSPMSRIMSLVDENDISIQEPGYFLLNRDQVLSLSALPFVLEQIRHRVSQERLRSFSVALNHLLNEIHAILFHLALEDDPKSFDANAVDNFLASRSVPNDMRIGVRNLFDRRNTNQVSHPGSEEYITWGVSPGEYDKYHHLVGDCLKFIL